MITFVPIFAILHIFTPAKYFFKSAIKIPLVQPGTKYLTKYTFLEGFDDGF
jgi:hypothetical protein